MKRRILSVGALALATSFGLFSVIACFAGSYEFVLGGVTSWAESIVSITFLARAIAWASVAMLYFVLPLAIPLAVSWWFAWVGAHRGKVKPAELRRALQSYFTSDDLSLLARRLSLPLALKSITEQIIA